MDEFAQSREDDDLFADEFEPVSEETVTAEDTPEVPVTEQAIPAPVQQQQRNGRREGAGDRRQRGRGGGVGGRGGTNNGLTASRYATTESPQAPVPPAAAESAPLTTPTTNSSSSDPTIPPNANPAPIPQQPAMENTRIPAVRGDRSATGGPAHKKLTEEELTAKLEKMAILNAQKAESHRLSEADQAAFQHREKELAKERREKSVAEKRNERVMEMERAKNRERKMKAQGGREWDSEKVESDIVDGKSRGRTSEYVRGGHGGVIRGRGGGLAGSRYAEEGDEQPDTAFMRGKGGFEIRGRGGRGRGGRGGGKIANPVPSAEDFPSLPPAKTSEPSATPAKASEATPAKASEPAEAGTVPEQVTSPGEKPAGDWAEEMATPVEEKKMAI